MLKNRLLKVLPLLAAPLLMVACESTDTTGPADGSARVSLLLTDAPGDVEAAVVTITDIYLQGGGSEGRVYLRQDEAVTTNLLDLSNDVIELVDDYEIPAGTYSQLRFVISGAYLEVENSDGGTTIYATSPDYEGLPTGAEVDGELHCPSCAQSGIKVLLSPVNGDFDDDVEDPEEIEDEPVVFDGEQTILVDFDVSRSFGKAAGNSGRWIMRPTLKATRLLTAAEIDVTLALNDTAVHLPIIDDLPFSLGSFEVTLAPAAGGDAKTAVFTDADEDGVWEAGFGYLFPGEYAVGLAGVPGISFLTTVALPVVVTVDEGEAATVDLRLSELTLIETTE